MAQEFEEGLIRLDSLVAVNQVASEVSGQNESIFFAISGQGGFRVWSSTLDHRGEKV